MSAAINQLNEQEVHEDDQELDQEGDYDDPAPTKKKSSLIPYLAAGGIALSVGGFMVYKMMGTPAPIPAQMSMPANDFQQQVQQQAPIPMPAPLEMNAPIQMPAPSGVPGMMPSAVSPILPDVSLGMDQPGPESELLQAGASLSAAAQNRASVNAPSVNASPAVSADIDTLKKEVRDMRARADKIEGQINAMSGTLQDVNKKIDDLKPASQATQTKKPEPAKASGQKPAPRKPAAQQTKRQEVILDNYTIYGLRADRVWMRHKGTQNTFDAAVGDSVPGAGVIEHIDLQSRTVVFRGGKKLSAQ